MNVGVIFIANLKVEFFDLFVLYPRGLKVHSSICLRQTCNIRMSPQVTIAVSGFATVNRKKLS